MAIADKLLELNDVKQDIKTAIEGKDVSMTGVPFTGYPAKIDSITTGGGSATIPVVRMDKITNTIDLSSFDIPFPAYQLDIEPNKKYVIKSQPENTTGLGGVYVIFTPTGLDYTQAGSSVEYNDTEYKEFTIDIYFEKEAIINFVDFTVPVILYTKVNANVDYTVNEDFFLSIVLPGETLYTISMVDGNVLIYGWE